MENLKSGLTWWKILALALLAYTVVAGFMAPVPRLPILNETIRNLFFHVPLWFTMIVLMGGSMIYSIMALRNLDPLADTKAHSLAVVGMMFGLLGLATGSVWARFTWDTWWAPDPKLNGALVAVLVYAAYFFLRASINDETKKASLSASYNILAFFSFLMLIMVYPRLKQNSLHPGVGGNPGFNAYDLDSNLRMVFYPAVIGWILTGTWIASLTYRYNKLVRTRTESDYDFN